jgi:hypothetical protein
MAFILHQEGLSGLELPVPAVVQEYVDHNGVMWKVYVAGSKVVIGLGDNLQGGVHTWRGGGVAGMVYYIVDMMGIRGEDCLPAFLFAFLTGCLAIAAGLPLDHTLRAPSRVCSQVFTLQRKSTPNLGPLVAQLAAAPEADIPAAINFDSLHSLPTSLPWARPTPATQQPQGVGLAAATQDANGKVQQQQKQGREDNHLVREEALIQIAAILQRQINLTLFGFDLVFDRAAGEWSGWNTVAMQAVHLSKASCMHCAAASLASDCYLLHCRRNGDCRCKLFPFLQGHRGGACRARGGTARAVLRAHG